MNFRAALHRALWLTTMLVLGGCASLQSVFSDEPPAPPPEKPAPAQFQLDVVAPPALRELLLRHLDLARLQHAPEADSVTGTELDRLIAAAVPQARSLLETEGYFNPVIKVQRQAPAGQLPVLRIDVDPGPRATITRLTLEVQG
jgi:translocation and assembly module TamA